MSSYHYRGKRYTKRQTASAKAWRSVKKIGNRVFDAIQGGHPGGAQKLVAEMIERYPEKPRQPAEAAVEAPVETNGKKDGVA
jgi:hypothetical protein